MFSPWVWITSLPPSPPDHTALWMGLLAQIVIIGVFIATQRETRRRDRQAVLDGQEKERESLRLNVKRDVFLEVAPAIQQNLYAINRLVDFRSPLLDLASEVQATFQSSAGAIAKLQAVAGDETLEAARRVQTFLATFYLRLLFARAALQDRKDPAAVKEIAGIWKREIVGFPPLMADLVAHARAEIYMELDRKRFEDGLVDSNNRLIGEMEAVLGTF